MSKSAKSKKGAVEPIRPVREKNYKLWIISYHGNGLKPIRDEFIKRVTDGLRRNIFVIDLDGDQSLTSAPSPFKRSSSFSLKKVKSNTKNTKEVKKIDLLTTALNGIISCRQEYDFITETIEREKKFNLLEYWKQDLPLPNVPSTQSKKGASKDTKKGTLPSVPEKATKGGGDKTTKGAGKKTGKMTAKQTSIEQLSMPECPALFPKVHNKVGRPPPLSKRKYIEDWPENSKIFIVFIIKDQESAKKLYIDLLSRSEPVQAIIHYLPQESAYDILLPQKHARQFLLDTWEEIQKSIYQLRQISLLKPVGMFQQQLPVISSCLAEKLTHQIFDELTWYLYDLEILHQHYRDYYFNAFHVTNVAMDTNVNVAELREFAESLSIQGHFLQSPMPAMVNDIATIAIYLESLLSTVEQPANLLTELDMLLLSAPSHRSISGSYSARVLELIRTYRNSFLGITRLKHYNRLILDDNNRLLFYLATYTNLTYFRHMYHCCLEYNILRNYVINSKFLECIRINDPLEVDLEPFYFPAYCKYFPTHDGILQHLEKLMQTYTDYTVDIMLPGMKLYRFKRRYNEVIEEQKMIILPSRLCFRDFTLFQMEEFLENLITPEMREAIKEAQIAAIDPEYATKRTESSYHIDPNIFIRPKSLKARKLAAEQTTTNFKNIASLSKTQSAQKLTKSTYPEYSDVEGYVGLPPGHPLLKGYNLEDIRQEVSVKTSTYYFEEGFLRLYEDRLCFSDLNKTINLKIKHCKINLNAVRNKLDKISHTIFMRTINYIRFRIMNNQHEFPKVVVSYPNGLVIHYNQKYCEQNWLTQETFNEEQRRIMSPDGSVIVFYKSEDVVRIMRYNGEVYELFQYEWLEAEEEGEEEMQPNDEMYGLNLNPSSLMTQSVQRASSHRSGKATEAKDTKDGTAAKVETEITDRKKHKDKNKIEKPDSKLHPKQSSEQEEGTSSIDAKISKSSVDYLKEVVENELRFLNTIMDKYCLNFVHLRITTTVGRIIHLNHTGKIFEKSPLSMVEWHDYFANESYAMRGDGVKLIWNKDELKCYHVDQTLIRAKAEDVVVSDAYVFEDIDVLISESSSHLPSPGEFGTDALLQIDDIYEALHREQNIPKNANKSYEQLIDEIALRRDRLIKDMNLTNEMKYTQLEGRNSDYTQYLEKHIEEELPLEKDIEYVIFQGHDYWAHQEHYATVHFTVLSKKVTTNRIDIEVIAADDTNIQVVPDDIFEREKDFVVNDSLNEMDGNEIGPVKIPSILKNRNYNDTVNSILYEDKKRNEEADMSGDLPQQKNVSKKFVIKIKFGDDVSITVNEEMCKIEANIERNDAEYGIVPDKLQLKFNFDDKFVEIFKNFTQCIADFKNYSKSAYKEKTFLEVENNKTCNLQGFDFMEKIPQANGYSYAVSNTVTVLKPLCTMIDNMVMNLASYSPDMKKFPRFRKRESRRSIADSFPRVASCSVYIKIPKQLSHSDEIEKFVQPFDTISFKRMRRQMRENIIFHIKPQIRMEMQRLTSRNSWKRRQTFHKCRLVLEMQRKGLYHAMLKHSAFPNYQNFRDRFDYHVKHIDFFDFMVEKCSEEALKKKKAKELLAEERGGMKSKFWSHGI